MSEFVDGRLDALAEFGPNLIGGVSGSVNEIPFPQRDVHVKNAAA